MDSGVDSDSTGLKDWVKPKGCVCVWGGVTETWKMKRVSSEQNRENQPPVHEQLFVFVSVVSSAHGLFLITDAIAAL